MPDTRPELISVIVPIFNAEPYLDQCLDSISRQTHGDLQIICLNDGSTDNSLAIMEKHAQDDPRIEIIDKQNEGYGASCNRGIDAAKGTWIAIVEPDDWIEPGMYESMLSYAKSLPETCDIVKTPYWRITMPDTPEEKRINCSFKGRVKPRTPLFAVSSAPHLLRHHPSIWSALYRASFLRDNSIRFHEIPGAGWADNPFLIDTLCSTDRIAYLDVPFYCYREETPEKTASMARNASDMAFDRWHDMMDGIERLGIRDTTILEEMYRRAFTYLSGITEHVGMTPAIERRAKSMCERMDQETLFRSKVVSPDSKELFASLLGIPCKKHGKGYWAKELAGEFFYTLHNAGLPYTLGMVKKILAG